MNKIICEAQDICKDYTLSHGQTLRVLNHINLSICPGEIVAIIGPSGSGKSTFLRILAGLEKPTTGTIYYNNKPNTGLLPNTSIVFQSFALYPWMTVKKNISLVLEALDLSEKEIEEKVAKVIGEVGLHGFEEAYPKELSGGMKQRVGLARALVGNPSLLLMDEPFSALDTFTAEGLRSELIRIWEDKDQKLSSIVIISHEISEVVYLADKIVVLGSNPGHVLTTLENKLPRPRDYRSPAFLDLMNLVHNAYYGKDRQTGSSISPTPLFPIGPDLILGLLRHIKREKGPCDLYKIAKETHQHFDLIMMAAESAELLHFIEITHQTALLTEAGKKYLEAKHSERLTIWKEQLLTLPLFQGLCNQVHCSTSPTLSKSKLLHFLSKELPNEDAQKQLETVIRWGRYGKLLTLKGGTICIHDTK